jgi:hypothetical protein
MITLVQEKAEQDGEDFRKISCEISVEEQTELEIEVLEGKQKEPTKPSGLYSSTPLSLLFLLGLQVQFGLLL